MIYSRIHLIGSRFRLLAVAGSGPSVEKWRFVDITNSDGCSHPHGRRTADVTRLRKFLLAPNSKKKRKNSLDFVFFLFLFGSLWTAAAATIGSAGRYDVWSTFGPQHTLYCTWGSVDESSGCHHRWLLPPNIHARGSVDGGWVVVVDADQYARGEGKNGRIQRRAKLRDGAAVSHSCWRRIGCRRGFLSPCLFLYIYSPVFLLHFLLRRNTSLFL